LGPDAGPVAPAPSGVAAAKAAQTKLTTSLLGLI